MRKDFFPDREADMLIWARRFSHAVDADAAGLGVPRPLADQLRAAFDRFAEAYGVATDAATRGGAAIFRKNVERREMEALARAVARLIGAQPHVSDQRRFDLGLSVRGDRRARVSPPDGAPIVTARTREDGTVRLTLDDPASPASRRRPDDAAGASVWMAIGERPPAAADDWSFRGNATRRTYDPPVPRSLPRGTRLWFRAAWYSPRGERGPIGEPASTYTTEGGPALPASRAMGHASAVAA